MLAALLLLSCAPEVPDWRDQLVPDSPCYRVDLSDGLSTTDPAETRDLFACLEPAGLEPYAPVVEAMEERTRAEREGLLELATLYDALPGLGLSLPGLLDAAQELLRQRELLSWGLELGVELVYARPWTALSTGELPTSRSALDAGVLAPSLRELPGLSSTLLDHELSPLDPLLDALASPRAADAWTSLRLLLAEPEMATRIEALPPELGQALADLADPSDDRWEGASGDALRDFASALLADGAAPARHLLPPLRGMLDDPGSRWALVRVYEQAWRDGRLDPLLAQLAYLASEAPDGSPLEPGEDSALDALLRLLQTADHEGECTVFGTDVHVADNFAVWLFELLADQDPDSIQQGLQVGGAVLDWDLTALAWTAESCGIDGDAFTRDLPALQRLVDPEVGDLLVVLLDFLKALRSEGSRDHIPELVELLLAAQEDGLVRPGEELLRPLGNSALAAEGLGLLPPLLDPWGELDWGGTWTGYDPGDFPEGRSPYGLEALLVLLDGLDEPDEQGRSPLDRLLPLLDELVERDGPWDALQHLGALLREPSSRAARLGERLPELLELSPGGEAPAQVAELLGRAPLSAALRLAELPGVTDALLDASAGAHAPLPYTCSLVTEGTLDRLLDTLALLLDFLGEHETEGNQGGAAP